MGEKATDIGALVRAEFEKGLKESRTVYQCLDAVNRKAASFEDAARYADEIGCICAEAFKKFCNGEYITIAEKELAAAKGAIVSNLKTVSGMSSDLAAEVQELLNEQAGISLVAKRAEFDRSAAENLADKFEAVASSEGLERAQWVIDEPVKTFSRKVVDETVHENVEFHHQAGLSPIIRRTVEGDCCEWCRALAGKYEYGDEPKDVYRRHERCQCLVEYFPGDGKRQNVHTKAWEDSPEDLEERRKVGLDTTSKHGRGENVTAEYFRNARPNTGEISFEEGFIKEENQDEIRMAQLLRQSIGGDIKHLCRSDSEVRADYLWNGKLWDLKTTTTANSANSAVRHGVKQIEGNPGGIVLNYGRNKIDLNKVEHRVDMRMSWVNASTPIDIIIVKNDSVVKVLRYK